MSPMKTPDLLTLAEAAEALRVSVRTMHRRIAEGFPAVKVGGEWRIPRVAIERVIERAMVDRSEATDLHTMSAAAPRGSRS